MRFILVFATIFYLGCEHDHAEFTLLDHTHQEYPDLNHEHDFVIHEHPVPTHSHDLVRHEHNYATPTHNHPLTEHGHSELSIDIQNAESQIRSLERFREHTHVDLHGKILVHDHHSPKLTFDVCPIPSFDIDWQGKAYFDFGQISDWDRQPTGKLILSDGLYAALVETSYILIQDEDGNRYHGPAIVMGGYVSAPTRVRFTHYAENSTDDGRLTADEVLTTNVKDSWLGLDHNNTDIQYQISIQEPDVFRRGSSSWGCQENQEKYARDLVEQFLVLAQDLIDIMRGRR